jgi:hypothetical protein
MFGDSAFRVDSQVTRGSESWVIGPTYFRGDQMYHEGEPFEKFVLRESRLTCNYEDTQLVPEVLAE